MGLRSGDWLQVFTATHQNKSPGIFEDSAAEIFVQQNVHDTATKIMIDDHTSAGWRDGSLI